MSEKENMIQMSYIEDKNGTRAEIVDAAARAKAAANEAAVNSLSEEIDGLFASGESTNVFNGVFLDGYMKLTGAVSETEGEYKHTEHIEVKSTTFIVTADSGTNKRRMNVPLRFVTAFDANKNVLSSYGLQNAGSETFIDGDPANATIITLDPSVKYIVLSVYNPPKYENISVSFDVSAINYEPYGSGAATGKLKEEFLPDNIKTQYLAKYLRGKTVAVFGDSIMYGAGNGSSGAVDILAQKYCMIVKKYCVSGASMGVRTDDPSYTVDEGHHIAKQVRDAIAAGITPDLIVFNGGANDIGAEIQIGEMSKVYTAPGSESNFADGFETVAYLLTKNFVGIPIIYMRAHNMSSRPYDSQVEYGELGNRIAEKWGIHNVDMYIRMNTQIEEYQTKYLADFTHPNKDGYERYYIPALEGCIFSEFV